MTKFYVFCDPTETIIEQVEEGKEIEYSSNFSFISEHKNNKDALKSAIESQKNIVNLIKFDYNEARRCLSNLTEQYLEES